MADIISCWLFSFRLNGWVETILHCLCLNKVNVEIFFVAKTLMYLQKIYKRIHKRMYLQNKIVPYKL